MGDLNVPGGDRLFVRCQRCGAPANIGRKDAAAPSYKYCAQCQKVLAKRK
jgi:RNA polymerase-binding transcription factor DksA